MLRVYIYIFDMYNEYCWLSTYQCKRKHLSSYHFPWGGLGFLLSFIRLYKRHFLQLIFYIQFCKCFIVFNLFNRLLEAKSEPHWGALGRLWWRQWWAFTVFELSNWHRRDFSVTSCWLETMKVFSSKFSSRIFDAALVLFCGTFALRLELRYRMR